MMVGGAVARGGDAKEDQSKPPERVWPVMRQEAKSFWFAEFCRFIHYDDLAVVGYWIHTSYPESPWYGVALQRYRQYERWAGSVNPDPPHYGGAFRDTSRIVLHDLDDFSFDDCFPYGELPSVERKPEGLAFDRFLKAPARARSGIHAAKAAPCSGLDFTLDDLAAQVPVFCLAGFYGEPEEQVFSFTGGLSH
jgi:hypothetical protein